MPSVGRLTDHDDKPHIPEPDPLSQSPKYPSEERHRTEREEEVPVYAVFGHVFLHITPLASALENSYLRF